MENDPERGRRAARQTEVIAHLEKAGAKDVAARLSRCAVARADRRRDAWPWKCRSPGCAWCGVPAARRWWRGLRLWAEGVKGAAVTVVVVPASGVGAAPRLRRAFRDVRDRAARDDTRWRAVAVAGMLGAEGRAVALVVHPGRLQRAAVERAVRRRWRDAVFPEVPPDPDFAFAIETTAAIARARRGTEPLRVLVMPQRPQAPCGDTPAPPSREPMPMAVAIGPAESFWGPPTGTDTLGQ